MENKELTERLAELEQEILILRETLEEKERERETIEEAILMEAIIDTEDVDGSVGAEGK